MQFIKNNELETPGVCNDLSIKVVLPG